MVQSLARLTLQNKDWIESERKKKAIKEIEECSFKPSITQKAKDLKQFESQNGARNLDKQATPEVKNTKFD